MTNVIKQNPNVWGDDFRACYVMRALKLSLVVVGLGCLFVGKWALASPAGLTPVTLQLKWQHQFQFAGYYAAIEKGFYHEAGLDVTLLEASVGQDTIATVLAGEADFGVGTSEVLLNYYQGDPIVVLAAIMQHSPLAFATISSSGAANIHQLAGDPIMLEPSSLELLAYLRSEGVDIKRLHLVDHQHEISDLIAGKVRTMSIYTTDEPFSFAKQGVDVQLFHPIMAGIDFYGDNLFTTQTMVERFPERVEAFRQASLMGWRYAMQHPDEIIDLIQSTYSERKSPAHLAFEAEKMRELMLPDIVELGYMNPGRWQHIAHSYYQLGLLPENFEVEGMLYQTSDMAYQRLKQQFYYLFGGLLLVGLLALIFYRQYHLANLRHKQFEALFENAPVSLMEIDEQGTIYHWNDEAENTFQYSADEALGQNVYNLVLIEHEKAAVRDIVSQALAKNKMIYLENQNRRKDGKTLTCQWSNMPFESGHLKSRRVICMARDITQEKAMQEKLYKAAHYDDLTGLPNRVLILTLLKQAIAEAECHQLNVAVLFIDLDGFKLINDTHGHLIGDEVLKLTAHRIQQVLGHRNAVGRLAGDEFLAVISGVKNPSELESIQHEMMRAIALAIEVNDLVVTISASIGTTFYPQDARDIEQLIKLADQSMYKAKAGAHANLS